MRDYCPFESRVLSTIQRHRLLQGVKHLLAAVSGGADSVALLHALHSLKTPLGLDQLTVLHFDHQLRGKDSQKDALFVQRLAESLGLPCVLGSGDVSFHQREQKVSLEMAARACRHRFFQESLARFDAQAVALGHTANDQAEELLLRLLRGTGPSGMTGMRPKTTQKIIRPILFLTREDVLNYLTGHGFEFREDPTNLSSLCQRNVLRQKVFPLLQEHFHPRIVETLCRHAELSRAEADYWDDETERHAKSVLKTRGPAGISLRLEEFNGLHTALQRRIMRRVIAEIKGDLSKIETVHIEAVLKLARESASGKSIHLPDGLQIIIEHDLLRLHPKLKEPSIGQEMHLVVPAPGIYRFGSSCLRFALVEHPYSHETMPPAGSPDSALLDAEKIAWPLILRTWKPGDRFQPLGMKGTKKLQDFFVDAKIPRWKRWTIPLVCDQEKICWVVGYRSDERVRVGDGTNILLTVEMIKNETMIESSSATSH